MADHLSLQEAADALDVHYMTAYRYVRTGLLAAERQGRSWAVDPEELERFKAARDTGDEATRGGGRGRKRADWPHRFEARLIAGDRPGALQVLEGALAAGFEPADLYVDVVAPAMAEIGDRWAAGALDVAVEHRASVIVSQALAVLGARFTRRGVSRGVVVIGAAPGDRHALPGSIVADVIRLAGFEVQDLGADVPAESFRFAVEETDRLVAVGISATNPDNEAAITQAIDAIRSAADVPVLVGGSAVGDAGVAQALGADHWAADARSVVEVLEELVAG